MLHNSYHSYNSSLNSSSSSWCPVINITLRSEGGNASQFLSQLQLILELVILLFLSYSHLHQIRPHLLPPPPYHHPNTFSAPTHWPYQHPSYPPPPSHPPITNLRNKLTGSNP